MRQRQGYFEEPRTFADSRDVHVDAVSTRYSQGYRNTRYIGDQVSPRVTVDNESDKYFVYSAADDFRDEAGRRAPGTEGPTGGWSLSTDNFVTEQNSFMVKTPFEVSANADSILEIRADDAEFATDKLMMKHEVDVASVLFTAGNWTNSAAAGTSWDNTNTADVEGDIYTAIETVEGLLGFPPNTIVMDRTTWYDARRNSAILDLWKHVRSGVLREEDFAEHFEIENFFIARAIKNTAQEGASKSMSNVFGKNCWVGYIDPSLGRRVVSALRTFVWSAANRVAETGTERLTREDWTRVIDQYDIKVTSADAGYLITSTHA